ncbi:succinate dehydrogenase cytochrome b558 subunit [Rubeoparvulum massiliense]|uniref:succinate dehydrogenase cytochrome b558 subunit n=1 Tax=Rubeoparvulum massiliense TaxID=1631346 RepID=UPI00065E3772|nr:succinate dehydrogenase cytochrome b558 subunit [Rubeoparvulum massiliense]
MAKTTHYFNRKLHSLLGVIPVGAFLCVHLFINSGAFGGREVFNARAEFMESLPFLLFLEIFLIFVPILYHGIYGLFIAFQAKNNVGRFGFLRNVNFMLQRVTGIFLIIWLTWHVWETRMQVALGYADNTQYFDIMRAIVANPISLALYVIGLLSATFHFANGLSTFLITWGITIGPRSQKIFGYVSAIFFLLISTLGIMALYGFVVNA